MFEGTPNAPKGAFDRVIQGGGGINNGSTRPDYTNYIASAPVSALEPILWLEADRMKTLDFSPENLDNQRDVVKEEIRVNVKNRPYGLFFWTDLSALAFDKWANAHDGYGSFDDLDAATSPTSKSFHKTYYAPGNAVLAIAGDVDAGQVFALAAKYFGGIPSQPLPPPADFSEPLNTAERPSTETDAFARVPGLAVGWKAPLPGTPDYVPAAVLGELLAGGEASRFYQRFVKEDQTLLQVQGRPGLADRQPAEQQRPVAAGDLRALQARRRRPLAGRRHGRRGRQDRRRPGRRRGVGAHQNEDAVGLLRFDGTVDLARQHPRSAPALHRRRRLDQRLPRPDRGGHRRRRPAGGEDIPDRRQPLLHRPPAGRDPGRRLPARARSHDENETRPAPRRISLPMLLALLALSASAASAAEEKPLPKDLPPYGAEKPLPVPTIVQKTLPNGLTVWLVPRAGFPS